MPAPVSSSSPARTTTKVSASKPSAQVTKKKRIVRRRGRAPGDITSDDEIEREAATDDSDSEEDLSSLSSDSDSDTEPVSEEVVTNGHTRVLTPNISQSPGDRGAHDKPAEQAESFFAPNTTWSEMVADDEKANEAGDLPVIEFADFDGQHVPVRSRPKKAKKPVKAARSAPEAPALTPQVNDDHVPNEAEELQHVASSSRSRSSDHPKRLPGQTARQAYQQRLESDPSYVPTVGGFWSHDDRLLDKDLRSLSGWWRDRRGGRGRGNGFRGRGRGGFPGGFVGEGHEGDGNEGDLPPIERTWGHDGFEEMKKREELRKAAQAQTQRPPESATFHGRGFVPGRGGRRGFGRGGYVNASGRLSADSTRIWFVQKPDKMWTKQHEGYLYLDPALRPTPGQGPGIIVKLPGNKEVKVVRIPFRPRSFIKPLTHGADKEVKVYTVNLPDTSKETNVSKTTEEVTTVTSSLAPKVEDLVPATQPVPPVEIVAPAPPSPVQPTTHRSPPDLLITTPLRSEPEASVRLQLEQLSVELEPSDPARAAKTEEAVMRNPLTESHAEEALATHGEEPVPTLPTMYSPPLPQPSPSYPSYGYPTALPPGIAMNQHGVPYELATGRPVYLQAAPPPMYNPRPVMHSHLPPAFIPTHMPTPTHAHPISAVSPDFLAHSASNTPPMNGFIDPSTGTPIFSFPRQTSRIEIRAPDASAMMKPQAKTPAHMSSGLRTSAASFEPSRTLSDSSANGYYPTLNSPENASLPSYAPVEGVEGMIDGIQHDPAMMGYAPYPQQQYYYPEAYGYAYNPYMDMQHVQSYDGTVYY
ncbi:hypothetical protein J132_00351 [Termitomyces sp. J132]|nr:hypothetical protein H2248_006670 [Termitomyces sp. 'cryptogamus']KNZ76075.1 hypothetical protein J132_00351 [Termitomyces sp. J132]